VPFVGSPSENPLLIGVSIFIMLTHILRRYQTQFKHRRRIDRCSKGKGCKTWQDVSWAASC